MLNVVRLNVVRLNVMASKEEVNRTKPTPLRVPLAQCYKTLLMEFYAFE
jgi:hypothetical protein